MNKSGHMLGLACVAVAYENIFCAGIFATNLALIFIFLFAATFTEVFVLLKLPVQLPSLQLFAAFAVQIRTVPSFSVFPIATFTYLNLNAALIFMFFVTVSFTVVPVLPLASPPQADRSQCFAGIALQMISVPS